MKSLKLKTKIPVKKKIGSRPYNVPRKTLLHVTRKISLAGKKGSRNGFNEESEARSVRHFAMIVATCPILRSDGPRTLT